MEASPLRNLSKLFSLEVSPARLSPRDRRLLMCHSEKKSAPESVPTKKIKWKKQYGHFLSPYARRNLNFPSFNEEKRSSVSSLSAKNLLVYETEHDSEFKELPDETKYVPSIYGNCSLLKEGCKNDKNWHVLGRGCFGIVIKAKYKDKSVAAKVIQRKSTLKRESLLREKNAINLVHQNIIKVQEVVNIPNMSYGLVVMELWHSTDLQHLIEDHPLYLDFHRKVRYMLNLCFALDYCHSNGIIHMDVKPKNILVNKYNGLCKLCDFGNSCNLELKDQVFSSHQGTVKYMAPELFSKVGPVTEKVDVYSLGITMWQILHEEIPYKSENLDSIVYKVVAQNYRPKIISSICRLTTNSIEEEEFISLYENCWKMQPALRPTIKIVIKKLETLKGS